VIKPEAFNSIRRETYGMPLNKSLTLSPHVPLVDVKCLHEPTTIRDRIWSRIILRYVACASQCFVKNRKILM